MDDNNQLQEIDRSASLIDKVSPRINIKSILILLVLIVVFGGLLTWNSVKNSSRKQEDTGSKQVNGGKFLANNTIVYGYWTGDSSRVEVVDLSTNKNSLVAVLPSNIKQITALPNNKLLYLKDTNELDYAKSLVLYDIATKNEQIIADADSDFGLDEYAISRNGRYIVLWELMLPTGGPQLIDARSRIYSLDIENPNKKNLIYDEIASPGTSIRYPIGITSSGEIYLNKFIPNAGMGWSYGISSSNFTGTSKQDIASMPNGSYANQPVLSQDESSFVFVGYDGSRGDGSEVVDGVKKVFSLANTIEILDVATKNRTKLVSAQGDDVFHSASFDLTTGDIIYQVISSKNKSLDIYEYSMSQNSSRKIDFNISYDNFSTNSINNFKTTLSNGKLLITSVDTMESTMGNLGSRYEQPLSAAYVVDQNTGDRAEVSLNGAYIQFISLAGLNFFDSKLLTSTKASAEGEQLQLETFTIKPTLAPIRIARNDPPRTPTQTNDTPQMDCQDTAAAQACSTLTDTADLVSCTTTAVNMCAGTCPLYLYGESGKKINVRINTPIFSPNAYYDPANGIFDITLLSDGKFLANGNEIQSLHFKYTPALKKLPRPDYGVVVKSSEFKKTLEYFSSRLGLNSIEAKDLLNYTQDRISSPYVYVSFYNEELSNKILPIQFSSQPDTYRNIVFYFEQFNAKPNIQPKSPVFDPIVRSGFTAIEISYIVR